MLQPQPIKKIINNIEQLVNIPSPSGYTDSIMTWLKGWLNERNIPYTITHKGAILVTFDGHNNERARLITAHTDTLGAMVKSINADGRLTLTKIGGFHWNAVEGEYCTIHLANGESLRGTIMVHQTSPHVYRNANEVPRDDEHMEVRIDAITRSQKESEALGINVGDFVSFDPRFEANDAGFIKSRHLDDKACVAILLALIESIHTESIILPHQTQFYISNNEEIGYGGNSNIAPHIEEYIAFDMAAIGDGQASDEYHVTICAKDSSGPYHYQLTHQLRQLAEHYEIPHKMDIYPFYGSDASAAMRAGFDLRHALFGPGIESSHAMERTHINGLEASYRLLIRYVTSEMLEYK